MYSRQAKIVVRSSLESRGPPENAPYSPDPSFAMDFGPDPCPCVRSMRSTSGFPVDHEVIAIVLIETFAPTHLCKARWTRNFFGPFLNFLLHQFGSPPLENVAASCGGSRHHRQHPQWRNAQLRLSPSPETCTIHHLATRIRMDESCPKLLCNGERFAVYGCTAAYPHICCVAASCHLGRRVP